MKHNLHATARVLTLIVIGLALWAGLTPAIAEAEETTDETEILVWPPPPEPSRIRYVGTLSDEGDVGKKPSFLEKLYRKLVGEKPGGDTGLVRPIDVYAVDSTRIFVTDSAANALLLFDFKKSSTRVLGQKGAGTLSKPMGLGGDGDGHVYVADQRARRIVVLDLEGKYVRAFGGSSILLNPVDVAVDLAAGKAYVADSYLHQVVVFDLDGNVISRIGKDEGDLASREAEAVGIAVAGHATEHGPKDLTKNRGGGEAEFLYPASVVVSSNGKLYVSDGLNGRIQAFDRDGTYLWQIGRLGDTPGSFARPKGLATDSQDHLYVVDASFNNLQMFDSQGRLLLAFGSVGTTAGKLWLPFGVHIDGSDRIYVADRYNARVQIFRYLNEVAEEHPATDDGSIEGSSIDAPQGD